MYRMQEWVSRRRVGVGGCLMIKLSRFAHVFEMDDGNVALYHSLRMKPVYLSREAFESLQAWLLLGHQLSGGRLL